MKYVVQSYLQYIAMQANISLRVDSLTHSLSRGGSRQEQISMTIQMFTRVSLGAGDEPFPRYFQE